jgi:hypothetical protein
MDSDLDKRTDISIKSNTSRRSRASVKSYNRDNVSEDISLSQLEMMANKKKLTKRLTELTVSDGNANKVNESVNYNTTRIERKVSSKSDLSSMSSSSNLTEKMRRKHKDIHKENRSDYIRKEKSELLYRFNKMNASGKWSSLRLDMNNSLDDIRNECERVKNEIQNERSVSFFKRMLLLGVQGVEMMNTKFDPLGVDLDGWSEAMGYSLENQEYDEVMAELCEKYKGAGQMSPEVKLIFMIISSATMFTISKKITKMDSSNAFKNIIGSFVGSQMQGNAKTNYNNNNYNDYTEETDTIEDNLPSKMRGPSSDLNNVLNNSDGIDINNILKTMNERKQEKLQEEIESSDDVFKSIPLTTKKKGRPKKTKTNNMQLNL